MSCQIISHGLPNFILSRMVKEINCRRPPLDLVTRSNKAFQIFLPGTSLLARQSLKYYGEIKGNVGRKDFGHAVVWDSFLVF